MLQNKNIQSIITSNSRIDRLSEDGGTSHRKKLGGKLRLPVNIDISGRNKRNGSESVVIVSENSFNSDDIKPAFTMENKNSP